MEYYGRYVSPFGALGITSDGESLTMLTFSVQKESGADARPAERELPVFEEVRRWLDVYFKGREPDFMPPVRLEGSAFQLQVWEVLRRIPYGEVVTYGEIAEEIASQRGIARMSAQAVGGAVGRNPVGILVPCHRVIGKNGNLTGFGGGMRWKTELLKLEGSYKDFFFFAGFLKKGKE